MPDDAWLALLHAARASCKPWRTALRAAGSIEALRTKSRRELASFGIDSAALHAWRSPDGAALARWRDWLDRPQHALVTLGSAAYPQRLAEIDDAPLALWARGAGLDLLNSPQLAIVGSRNPTTAGRMTAESFACYFAASGVTVASGLAMGIDAAAHRGALQGVASTVAVLGCGIDVTYPRCNASLALAITQSGVIVSEYPPGTPARAHRFPQRNRIIAGLTLGTLVVEATRRSGSLITARHAANYGREVFAIPGSIHNPLARGCHALIRDGAKLVEEGGDVLIEFAPLLGHELAVAAAAASAATEPLDLDATYASLVKRIGHSPITLVDLMNDAGLTAAELSSMLLVLEFEGHIEALPGGRYCRLAKRS